MNEKIKLLTSNAGQARFEDVGDAEQALADVDLALEQGRRQGVQQVTTIPAVQLAQRMSGAGEKVMIRMQQRRVTLQEAFKPIKATSFYLKSSKKN